MPAAAGPPSVNVCAAWADSWRHEVGRCSRPCRVVGPCVGLNAPFRAALEMGFRWESAGEYDMNFALLPALMSLGADRKLLFLGPTAGNVCDVDLSTLDLTADGLVSGPPCPPFSSIGRRLLEDDERSSVFAAVAKWILHLARYGQLKWWVIENVVGILRKRKGQSESFAEGFLQEMRRELGAGWHIKAVEANSINCLLPQHRPRVFFIGVSQDLLRTPRQQRIFQQPLKTWPQVNIEDFLERSRSDEDVNSLSVKQRLNLQEQLSRFRSELAQASGVARIAICDIARDPLRPYDSQVSVGSSRTLRTNCSYLWILPSEEAAQEYGPMGRFLRRCEKARFAGIVPSSLRGMSDSQVDVALGNTILVPLIGVVMGPVIRCWVEYIASQTRQAATPGVADDSAPDRSALEP